MTARLLAALVCTDDPALKKPKRRPDAEALKKSRVGGKELKPSKSQAEKTGRGDCVRTQRHVQQGARCSGG
jgi:hypothetical protein